MLTIFSAARAVIFVLMLYSAFLMLDGVGMMVSIPQLDHTGLKQSVSALAGLTVLLILWKTVTAKQNKLLNAPKTK